MRSAAVSPIPRPARLVRALLMSLVALVALFSAAASTPVAGAAARQSAGEQTADGVEIQVVGEPSVTAATVDAAAADLVHPASELVATLTFAADPWQGGFYRGDSQAYGRPWTAVYGDQSRYAQAAIAFSLDDAPTAPVRLTLVGLNDELGRKNPITVAVNGRTIFSGPSWFANWDGRGNGEAAPWTAVVITMPAAYLVAGDNEVSVANLQAGDNFDEPPYVLLGAARVEAPGVGGSISPSGIQVHVLPGS